MTIGIYGLYWEEQDLIYIGKSGNIEKRFKEHIRNMRSNKHSNYKVQEAYDSYKEPKYFVVEVCKPIDLDELEIYWTKEFNSIEYGLNIVEAGIGSGFGINHSGAKFTKLQVLQVFRHLYLSTYKQLSIREISKKLLVNESLIGDIKRGVRHTWLKDYFKYQYLLMSTLERADGRAGIWATDSTRGTLQSPIGIIYYVDNVNAFSKEHNLDQSAVCKVLNGKRSSHLGWKVPRSIGHD